MHEAFFGELDRYLFHRGTHYEIYEKMGAHPCVQNGEEGTVFVLWAPNAKAVSVVCDRNGWTPGKDEMVQTDGVWELFLPGVAPGERYKYCVTRADGTDILKIDPYAFRSELRPHNASVVADIWDYCWQDSAWESAQHPDGFLTQPMAVYEVHPGSWKQHPDGSYYNYRQLAAELADYVLDMGYTHVELMGVCEYPYDPSWGYQVTGYYCPTARYGSPEDFMFFVDYLHCKGIGVILDWVPAHFPKDGYALAEFDGTPLYEYADPLRAEYPQWGTKAFDLSKNEVSNFLIGSALFWIRQYHIDALRVDAVASMMYNSFGREKWRPNRYGGEHNLESFEFFRHLSSVLREKTAGFLIAEDSSILAGMTKPASEGGFGFGLKWNMGWMNEVIRYINEKPINRKYHHHLMTHTLEYAFDEHYILVLSHDEVVHGKGSMFNKSPGNRMEKFGSLKTCYTMMMGHPGKKLLFMGQDFGQEREWDYRVQLDWELCDEAGHRDVQNCWRALLSLYRSHPVLYSDTTPSSFEWINSGDVERSIFSFLRRNPWNYNDSLLFVCNFTPVGYDAFSVGCPLGGLYRRVFTTCQDEQDEAEWKGRPTRDLCDSRPWRLKYPLRPYESVIFSVPSRHPRKKPE